ncbi:MULTISPECIES: aliphatic sulfonate ABC transporter substrate-binding protein [Lysinibacillus]|uniref:Aliphatic sulfonate ABC transporter substrate-binding protein n=1 Tax=Lysinibacillus antri TaxID=2498145 RepID=A0A432LAT0_9BACI|nr:MULTISPECIES: aliphatic sulfonate ABC transporter substrate-binding protein [Lysinibacillus]RUL51572.1 aliphatic sulfonate ABC transporter substrate-binding protein [Lysinibacillus antri]TSI10860.1 aliphatic sulfonate ABC transporter substrate-binding protein [Lysinibacillus sp. BW-2-10]
MKKNKFLLVALLTLVIGVLAACGNSEKESESSAEKDSATEVRIGYFPNMTHIASIVALEKGFYQEQLGEGITIETKTFSDGSAFMEAMSTNAIDLGTVGPTPALNTFVKNPQHEIIAGAVNGGAVLVVGADSGINSVKDLAGKTVAVPTFGSTQDVGLMKSLQDAGLKVKSSGGDVNTIKQAPADTAALMLKGEIDAAATQEPWGVNIETNANAKLLLDQNEFAWGSESTNTVVTARKEFTSNNPELTKKALKAHKQAIDFINENPEEAIQLFLDHVKGITGKELSKEEVTKAFERLTPTTDINEDVLKEMATISKEAGYITSDNIDGLVNLSYLEAASK